MSFNQWTEKKLRKIRFIEARVKNISYDQMILKISPCPIFKRDTIYIDGKIPVRNIPFHTCLVLHRAHFEKKKLYIYLPVTC